MRGLARLVLVLLGLGLLAGVSVVAARNGLADRLTLEASKEMAAWRGLEPDRWNSVKGRLEDAVALDRSDPAIHELLGLHKSRRLDSEDYLQQAAVHYHDALKARPVSPYAWANLAEVLYRSGKFGPQLEGAIKHAAMLGSAEPQVQRTVVDLGLALWDEMPDLRIVVGQLMASGMRRNPLEMLQISERRGRLDVACTLLTSTRRTDVTKWSKFCQGTEATP